LSLEDELLIRNMGIKLACGRPNWQFTGWFSIIECLYRILPSIQIVFVAAFFDKNVSFMEKNVCQNSKRQTLKNC
jgi:hypothetical protein